MIEKAMEAHNTIMNPTLSDILMQINGRENLRKGGYK